MILKTTTTAAQEFKVIPRVFANDFSFSVRNENTNVETIYEVTTATTSGDYLVFSQAYSPVLVENHYIISGTQIIFCGNYMSKTGMKIQQK